MLSLSTRCGGCVIFFIIIYSQRGGQFHWDSSGPACLLARRPRRIGPAVHSHCQFGPQHVLKRLTLASRLNLRALDFHSYYLSSQRAYRWWVDLIFEIRGVCSMRNLAESSRVKSLTQSESVSSSATSLHIFYAGTTKASTHSVQWIAYPASDQLAYVVQIHQTNPTFSMLLYYF